MHQPVGEDVGVSLEGLALAGDGLVDGGIPGLLPQRSIWGAPTAGLGEMSKGGCFGHFLAPDDIFLYFFFTFQFRSGLWGPSQHGMGWAGPLHVGTGWESLLQPTQR